MRPFLLKVLHAKAGQYQTWVISSNIKVKRHESLSPIAQGLIIQCNSIQHTFIGYICCAIHQLVSEGRQINKTSHLLRRRKWICVCINKNARRKMTNAREKSYSVCLSFSEAMMNLSFWKRRNLQGAFKDGEDFDTQR